MPPLTLSRDTPSLTRKTVLVVEDDDDLRHMFRDALRFAGFEVREAADGPHALQIIDQTPPDLVVLDIILPTLDGYSVREEIASHAGTRHIPIVVVTGAVVNVDRLEPARVLHKPVAPDDLVAAVRGGLATFLARKHGVGRNHQ